MKRQAEAATLISRQMDLFRAGLHHVRLARFNGGRAPNIWPTLLRDDIFLAKLTCP